jgi:hypothetical protein
MDLRARPTALPCRSLAAQDRADSSGLSLNRHFRAARLTGQIGSGRPAIPGSKTEGAPFGTPFLSESGFEIEKPEENLAGELNGAT